MPVVDASIEEMVEASGIPSAVPRREVACELRSPIDDLVLAARDAGRSDAEIERLIAGRFGDALAFGGNFAWVYRRERALLHVSVFALSTIGVAAFITAGILAAQAGVAAVFSFPATGVCHALVESADILATVAAFAGLLSIERLFARAGFPKDAAILAAAVAALLVTGLGAPFLIFGLACGTFLRALRTFLARATAASWLVLGIACQAITILAERAGRSLLTRLQQL